MSNDDLAEDDCIGIEEQAANLILELWAEVERQARHVKELREKIDAERSCACSFDAPGDVCAAHSPALTRALAEVERLHKAHQAACEGGDLLRAENARLRAQVSEYFIERETHPVEET